MRLVCRLVRLRGCRAFVLVRLLLWLLGIVLRVSRVLRVRLRGMLGRLALAIRMLGLVVRLLLWLLRRRLRRLLRLLLRLRLRLFRRSSRRARGG